MADGFHVRGICKRTAAGLTPAANCPFVIPGLAIVIGQYLRPIVGKFAKMLLQHHGDIRVNLLSSPSQQRIINCIAQQDMLKGKTNRRRNPSPMGIDDPASSSSVHRVGLQI